MEGAPRRRLRRKLSLTTRRARDRGVSSMVLRRFRSTSRRRLPLDTTHGGKWKRVVVGVHLQACQEPILEPELTPPTGLPSPSTTCTKTSTGLPAVDGS
jgi:hypothetical protein